MLHGSPSAMELNYISTEDSIVENSDDRDDGDQELQPLVDAVHDDVDIEAAARVEGDAFEDAPSYSFVDPATADKGPKVRSLFETARASPQLALLFSYIKSRRTQHAVNGADCDAASHSS